MTKRETTTVRLTPETKKRVRIFAAEENMRAQNVYETIIRAGLSLTKKEILKHQPKE